MYIYIYIYILFFAGPWSLDLGNITQYAVLRVALAF